MAGFAENIRENTDLHDPVMVETLKESGDWTELDEDLWHALERYDDEEAQRLVLAIGFDLGDLLD